MTFIKPTFEAFDIPLPIRVNSGWMIETHKLMENNPYDDMHQRNRALFYAFDDRLKRSIEVTWHPDYYKDDYNFSNHSDDPEIGYEGDYILKVRELEEKYEEDSNKINLYWVTEEPSHEFTSRNRLEIVAEIERLMHQLKPYTDPRIMSAPGVINEQAESLRHRLMKDSLDDKLVDEIIAYGHKTVTHLLVDHDQMTRAYLLKIQETDLPKKLRNRVNEKLKSKPFRK